MEKRREQHNALLTHDVPLHYGVLYRTHTIPKKLEVTKKGGGTFWVRVNCLLRVGRENVKKVPFLGKQALTECKAFLNARSSSTISADKPKKLAI